jgi:hypothetical protein
MTYTIALALKTIITIGAPYRTAFTVIGTAIAVFSLVTFIISAKRIALIKLLVTEGSLATGVAAMAASLITLVTDFTTVTKQSVIGTNLRHAVLAGTIHAGFFTIAEKPVVTLRVGRACQGSQAEIRHTEAHRIRVT